MIRYKANAVSHAQELRHTPLAGMFMDEVPIAERSPAGRILHLHSVSRQQQSLDGVKSTIEIKIDRSNIPKFSADPEMQDARLIIQWIWEEYSVDFKKPKNMGTRDDSIVDAQDSIVDAQDSGASELRSKPGASVCRILSSNRAHSLPIDLVTPIEPRAEIGSSILHPTSHHVHPEGVSSLPGRHLIPIPLLLIGLALTDWGLARRPPEPSQDRKQITGKERERETPSAREAAAMAGHRDIRSCGPSMRQARLKYLRNHALDVGFGETVD
ncbi:hypothetical protein N7526_002883 [Penicillium atrosanguineum]|nr:hypothetical protein N7526_002883 [Penicillium atrosanguineum]